MRNIYLILIMALAAFYGYVAYVVFHPDYPSRAYRLYYIERVIHGLPGERYDLTYVIGKDAEPRHYGLGHGRDQSSLYFVLEEDVPGDEVSLRAWVDQSIHARMGDEGISADVGLVVNDYELGAYSFLFDKKIDHIEMSFPTEHLERGLNEIRVVAPEIQLPHGQGSVKPRIIPERLGEEERSSESYGKSIKWRGDWASATHYYINDTVRYQGRVYVCLSHHYTHTATELLTQLDDWPGPGQTLYLWHLLADTGRDGAGKEFIYALTDGGKPEPTSNAWGYDDPGSGWEDEPPSLTSNLHTLWRTERAVVGTPAQYDTVGDEWSNPKMVGRQRGQGDTKGGVGESINWRYDWTAMTRYHKNDAVSYRDRAYVCLMEHVTSTGQELFTQLDNHPALGEPIDLWRLMVEHHDLGQ